MVVKVGINGFGRIGRLAFRRIQNVEGVEVTRINDLTDPVMLAHLLKYDTTQGRFDGTVEVKEGGFEVNGKFVKVSAERDPEQIDWANDGVEIVLEATGFFATKAAAEKHLHANGGAKKVVITAPGGSDVKTIVFNTNHDTLDGTETVISGASCTTNCLAPMAKALQDNFGVKQGLMTTIHGYTEDPIVSSDVVGMSFGSLFDATQTKVQTVDGHQLVKTVSWYDNEMSYTSQLVRTLEYFAKIAK